MTWLTTMLTTTRTERRRAAQVRAAYQHWLATEHPRLWNLHGQALLADATPATLAERIAACDRLVAAA